MSTWPARPLKVGMGDRTNRLARWCPRRAPKVPKVAILIYKFLCPGRRPETRRALKVRVDQVPSPDPESASIGHFNLQIHLSCGEVRCHLPTAHCYPSLTCHPLITPTAHCSLLPLTQLPLAHQHSTHSVTTATLDYLPTTHCCPSVTTTAPTHLPLQHSLTYPLLTAATHSLTTH